MMLVRTINPIGILRPRLVVSRPLYHLPKLSAFNSHLRRYSTEPDRKTTLDHIKPKASSQLWTIPNILTYTRIITTPFIGYFITQGQSKAALLLFTYSCVTDFIDGYIARKYNMKSIVGSIIDPLADKFLMTVCTLSLAYVNSIPLGIASIIIGRDVMLSFMSFYYRWQSLDHPKTFKNFVSIGEKPTISVHPNMLGKVNTGLQMVYIGSLVYRPLIEALMTTNLEVYYLGLGGLVGLTTILSGATYIFSRNSMKYVK